MSDSYRPNYRPRDDRPPSPPPGARSAMYHFQGNANRERDRGGRPSRRGQNQRHEFRFRAPTKISERPLLQERMDNEEQFLGNKAAHDRFRDLNELTDSDEAEMEQSDDEEAPRAKRAKREVPEDNSAAASKWSNPDPYTSLPAPNETTGKKLDFVKMIRKARNDFGKSSSGLNGQPEDFISFGTVDEDDANPRPPSTSTTEHNPPGMGQSLQKDGTSERFSHASNRAGAPSAAQHVSRQSDDDIRALGKRKRGDDKGTRSKVKVARGRGLAHNNALVLDAWRAAESQNATPWWKPSIATSPSIALHREILDFYEWIRPQDFEFAVRADCIKRLSDTLSRFKPGELKAFGSFGAGLFLPTGDMDLVFLDRGFQARIRSGYQGISTPISNNQFRQWLSFIKNQGIAKPGSIVPIPFAKVPIIKFVERVSGLKVDLSFNNDTGLVAIETFQKWRRQHPAMPVIVSIIKQYLMIRGLNDVATGGLGGFSIICLVTSLLQHIPATAPSHNLGDLLVQFFNLYGRHLDRDQVAIRLDPPGYVDKTSYAPHLFNKDKKGRLTIIDPNRPENNISGGTSEIALIADSFAGAYDILQDCMHNFDNHDTKVSFLNELIGGNFIAYETQRNILRDLYADNSGHVAPAVIPPPPPPVAERPPPPPPPPSTSKASKKTMSGTSDQTSSSESAASQRMKPAQRLAARLKSLRPDLASKIGNKVSRPEAARLAGYKDFRDLQNDLHKMENGPQQR